ncbi:putative surface protein [Stigmatella aurantiaca DW4/3-1]|uniref:Putative surface protein n=1 Tax=Stigmatella aurantiaca (strain DW4/3-1) TaxID=378806 RepID=Q08U51_STIAD|nr:putative surface protein [Stigmatella aurantiaca DW4/3-1]
MRLDLRGPRCHGQRPVRDDLTANIVATRTPIAGQPGSFTISYSVTDPSGNTATSTSSRTVRVEDNEPPVLALNGPATQGLECGTPFNDPGATAQDACVGDLTANITRSGEVNPNVPNPYTVIYNVSDPSGQSAPPVTRQVNVSDTLAPVITVQGPLNDTFECGGEYTDPGASANDQCYGNLTGAVVATRTTVPGQPGNFTITYSVQDPAGNTATSPVSRTVKVNDDTPPSISLIGANSITVECSEPFVDPGASAIDLCAGTVPVTVTGTVDTTQAGNYVLSYSAQDTAGNTSPTVTRTVQVNDSLPPAITLLGDNPVSLECNRDSYVEPGATANDLCSGSSTVIADSSSVNPAIPGDYAVNYTATDKSGRQSTAIRDVNVVDTLAPALALVGPAHQPLECGTPYADPGATANDLCFGDLSGSVQRTGSINTHLLGSQSVSYSVTDPSGYSASPLNRTVTVSDSLAPLISVRGPLSDTFSCGGQYIDPGATASDACAGDLTPHVVATRTPVPGKPNTFTISYSVQDPSGNRAVAPVSRTVTQSDISVRLNDYNVFLTEDYTLGTDVEGRVAAGGNISMTNFSVGWNLPAWDSAPVLVAGGNLTLSQGGIWGDASHGGTYSAKNVSYVRGAPSQGFPVDFATRAAQVRTLSTRLASLPANSLTRRESWGGLMLSGSSSHVNVFDVNASDFSGTVLLSIDAPSGSLVVLNIRGASATLSGGHSFSGGIDQRGVLFNFVDATSINASRYSLWGTLLAPNAHVNFNNGSFDGGLYAKSLSGNAEGHLNPLGDWDLCLPPPLSPAQPLALSSH